MGRVLVIDDEESVVRAVKRRLGRAGYLIDTAGSAAEGPAQSVVADEVGHHLDVFLGVRAQRRELAIADAAVRVQLQSRAREDEHHHAPGKRCLGHDAKYYITVPWSSLRCTSDDSVACDGRLAESIFTQLLLGMT